ncbi:Uncharacterised protein [Mycobacterium tuberculosis]|nr:Uncharacterised protein [Mycobacterium tuberculosis]
MPTNSRIELLILIYQLQGMLNRRFIKTNNIHLCHTHLISQGNFFCLTTCKFFYIQVCMCIKNHLF